MKKDMYILNKGLERLGAPRLNARQIDMFSEYTKILLHYN